MSVFFLASFLIYMNAAGQKKGSFIISSLLFFLSALFKVTAIALLPLYIAYDYSLKKGMFAREVKDGSAGRNLLRRYLPFLIAALAYLSLRTYAIGGFIPEKGHPDFTPWQILINVFPLVSKYIELLVLPLNLNFLYVFHPVLSLFEGRTLIALAVNALFIVSACSARRKTNGLFLALLWIIVPLLPVLYFPAFTGESVFAERYLYLPSAGFVIAAAIVLRIVYRKRIFKGVTVPILLSGLALVVFLFGLQTVMRNHVWKSDFSLWTDTIRRSPDSSQAYNNLGIALDEKGQLNEAIACFQQALRLNPNHAKAHNNLGNAYYRKGLLDEAVREYRNALSLDPNYRDALYNLSVVSAMRDAVMSYKK
jgi:tetratricopeptide (TPR) repeat protein